MSFQLQRGCGFEVKVLNFICCLYLLAYACIFAFDCLENCSQDLQRQRPVAPFSLVEAGNAIHPLPQRFLSNVQHVPIKQISHSKRTERQPNMCHISRTPNIGAARDPADAAPAENRPAAPAPAGAQLSHQCSWVCPPCSFYIIIDVVFICLA
jgi:hypothetical protein